MITPNKVVPLSESAFGHVGAILRNGPEPIGLLALFGSVIDEFESIDHFLLTMDALYVMDLININLETGVVSYAH